MNLAFKKTIYSPLLIITIILLIIGIVFVYSASIAVSLEINGESFYFLKKHCYGITIGLIGLFCAYQTSLYYIKKISSFIFITTLLVTMLTLFSPYAVMINGSARWIKLLYLKFQPSELLKIGSILYGARFLSVKKITFLYLIKGLILLILLNTILLLQPDFGTALLLSTVLILLFLIVHGTILNCFLIFMSAASSSMIILLMRPYRVQRIITFLNPWADPQGSGFQIIQSFIAIGSGGFFGNGITHSQQKLFYLPMQYTDFIFAIIGEEIGFIGCLFIILLYCFFLWHGVLAALLNKDPYQCLVGIGFTLLITLQAIINIAVTCGMAPTKGIGLPLISYGNTSLICCLVMIGFILQVSRNNHF